ncbi:hypothetical protein HKA99_29655, partial [Vibrio parahaemolyticus]|nr:hypothetical protein [Vibrio parahaemolyticus]
MALATRAQAAAQLRDWAAADAALAQLEPLVQDDARARRAAAMLRAESWLLRGDAARADQALAAWRGDGSRGMELLSARIGLAAQG